MKKKNNSLSLYGNTPLAGSMEIEAKKAGTTLEAHMFANAEVIMICDMSSSMNDRDAPGHISRQDYAQQQMELILEKHPGKVAMVEFADSWLFRPNNRYSGKAYGSTNLSGVLKDLYEMGLSDIGLTFYIVCDGEPNSAESALQIARKYNSTIHAIYCGAEDNSYTRGFMKDLAQANGMGGMSVITEEVAQIAAPVLKLMGGTA